jgi:predicted phosphohydrolase
MRITLIADTHDEHHYVRIKKTDLLILAGDYGRRNREKDFIGFADWLKAQPADHKILINGNHDRYWYRHTARANEILGEEILLLENESHIIDGIHIWGSPLTVPVVEGMYSNTERPEQARKLIWESIPDGIDILITHSPPFGILDEVEPGEHYGCKTLREKVFQLKPKYHLFGHIHQAYGETEIEGIRFKNATLVNDNEKIVKPPIVFDY